MSLATVILRLTSVDVSIAMGKPDIKCVEKSWGSRIDVSLALVVLRLTSVDDSIAKVIPMFIWAET